MTSRHTGERCLSTDSRFIITPSCVDKYNDHLLSKFDIVHHLQRKGEVAEKGMDAKKADDAEISQHSIEWLDAVLANDFTMHRNGDFVNWKRK